MIASCTLSGLYEELLSRGLTRVSKAIALKTLNAEGSATFESWVVSSDPVLIDKDDIYTYHLAEPTFDSFIDLIESDSGKYISARLDSATNLDMASTSVRTMITGLYEAGLCTDDECNSLLRIGEVKTSRAEELFGRKLELEDF